MDLSPADHTFAMGKDEVVPVRLSVDVRECTSDNEMLVNNPISADEVVPELQEFDETCLENPAYIDHGHGEVDSEGECSMSDVDSEVDDHHDNAQGTVFIQFDKKVS